MKERPVAGLFLSPKCPSREQGGFKTSSDNLPKDFFSPEVIIAVQLF